MDITQLETLGKVAGIGGIAIGVFALVAGSTLERLTRLTRKQSFVVVITIVLAAWSLGVGGLYVWWDVSRVHAAEQQSSVAMNSTLAPPTITNAPPTASSVTNAVPVPTRKETLRLDLKKPMSNQIRVFDGDSIRIAGGAVDLIARADFGSGWKSAKKGQRYTAKASDGKTFTPRFDSKEIKVFSAKFDLIKIAKSAVIIVEVSATSNVNKSRKP